MTTHNEQYKRLHWVLPFAEDDGNYCWWPAALYDSLHEIVAYEVPEDDEISRIRLIAESFDEENHVPNGGCVALLLGLDDYKYQIFPDRGDESRVKYFMDVSCAKFREGYSPAGEINKNLRACLKTAVEKIRNRLPNFGKSTSKRVRISDFIDLTGTKNGTKRRKIVAVTPSYSVKEEKMDSSVSLVSNATTTTARSDSDCTPASVEYTPIGSPVPSSHCDSTINAPGIFASPASSACSEFESVDTGNDENMDDVIDDGDNTSVFSTSTIRTSNTHELDMANTRVILRKDSPVDFSVTEVPLTKELLTFNKAASMLRDYKFSQHGLYWFWWDDNRKRNNPMSMADFRQKLCGYRGFQGDNARALELWAAFGHIKQGLFNQQALGDIARLESDQAWLLLQAMGVEYRNGSYSIPSSDSTFNSPDNLRWYLRCHGLGPKNGDINDNQYLSLQLWCAEAMNPRGHHDEETVEEVGEELMEESSSKEDEKTVEPTTTRLQDVASGCSVSTSTTTSSKVCVIPYPDDSLDPHVRNAIVLMRNAPFSLKKDDSWNDVLLRCKQIGWTYDPASFEEEIACKSEHVYVLPGCNRKDKTFKRDVHFFGLDGAKKFAREYYGWDIIEDLPTLNAIELMRKNASPIQEYDSWHIALKKMKATGWNYQKVTRALELRMGTYVWCLPGCNASEDFEECVHYMSEEGMKDFARKVFRWRGDVEEPRTSEKVHRRRSVGKAQKAASSAKRIIKKTRKNKCSSNAKAKKSPLATPPARMSSRTRNHAREFSSSCSSVSTLISADSSAASSVQLDEYGLNAIKLMENIDRIESRPLEENDTWATALSILEFIGWERKSHRRKAGLGSADMYIMPGCKIGSGFKEGVHYLEENDLKDFARRHYGWQGPYPMSEQRVTATPNSTRKRLSKSKKFRSVKRSIENEIISPPKKSKENRIGSVTTLSILETACKHLHPSSDKHTTVVSADVQEVKSFLENCVENLVCTEALYLCGQPGTGKTTAVGRCLKTIQADFPRSLNVAFVNAAHIQTATLQESIFGPIVEALQYTGKRDSSFIQRCLASVGVKSKNAEKITVLVIDEIDNLISSARNKQALTMLEKLLKWSVDPTMRFCLIGIANKIQGLEKAMPNLGVKGNAPNPRTVVFKPYTCSELVLILKDRVGDVFDERALEFIGRKVSASSGDARRALELAANAVTKCIDSLTEKEKTKRAQEDAPIALVKVVHVMKAVRECSGGKIQDMIAAQTTSCKIVLCVAVQINRALFSISQKPFNKMKSGYLLDMCKCAASAGLMENLDPADFLDLLETLGDASLLMLGPDFREQRQRGDARNIGIKVDVQLEDVECALEQLFDEQPFYSKIAENVKHLVKSGRIITIEE